MWIKVEIPDEKSCEKCKYLWREETMEVGMSFDKLWCGLFKQEFKSPFPDQCKPCNECMARRRMED